ncbi:MAG TPA: serine/threonine-protein kinase, partial [Nannocystaceae bacterium]|nr:serine/threonine-protein kinase [Nannocystaceae bacterium]
MGCADSAIVAAWISNRLAPDALAELEAHADRCDACLHLLAAIGRVCADPRSREIHHTHGAPVLADWAVLAAAPGAAIGRYELVGVLGRGGFGVVYEARDRELGRDVAIKALFAAADAVNAAAIRSEARALAALNHPNVVRLYDVVETGARVYLVMELVRGTTMRAWQRDRSDTEIVDGYLAAASGLSAIHDVGLVHADVKPDNLLVTHADMRVLVTDFGLARAVATAAGDVAGTPRYMAPEQRAGARVSASADQYAWCVALWEALHRALPSERALRPTSARVRSVLRRGLAPQPSDRWPSMHALALALRHALRPSRRWWALAAGLGLAGA